MPNTHTHSHTLLVTQRNFAGDASTSETLILERHVRQCLRANGAWHSVRYSAENVGTFLRGRVVTLAVLVAGLLLALSAYQ
jgi:hypothetical protein